MPSAPTARLAEYATQARRSSEVAWSQLKRWFLAAAVIGLIAGLAVTGLEYAIEVLWGTFGKNLTPLGAFVLPTLAGLLSGLSLQYLTLNPGISGTEEYIQAFHERGGVFRFRSVPGKLLASVATLGFGGSAGMEGPSIYAGSAIGAYVLRLTRRRLGFSNEDVRALMVAGAAAGVSAVFKAPLTGIIFALEVPYHDDLTREALVPSLVSSVVAYLVLIQFMGVKPLFALSARYTLAPTDLLYSLVLGLFVGLIARVFVHSYHALGHFAASRPVPLWVRTTAGGLVSGLLGCIGLLVLNAPVATGIGYSTITNLLASTYGTPEAALILVLKAGATVSLLAAGAAGGIFIPMIVLGADAGALLRGIIPGAIGPLFPVVGMAAFLAAGYNTPIAATVFIAETTGGAGYI
ncbi:MAG TPA: chloride channel protein, partial [Coriobacteriia bacterium]|nr:chloride channel protein [Coriobacteriia bacterium]